MGNPRLIEFSYPITVVWIGGQQVKFVPGRQTHRLYKKSRSKSVTLAHTRVKPPGGLRTGQILKIEVGYGSDCREKG